MAHFVFFVAVMVLGLLLCGASPVLIVWMTAGIYLGRDLAILCHYAPVLFLLLLAALLAVFMTAKHLAVLGRQHSGAGLGLTVLLLAVQIWVVWAAAVRSR